MGDAALHLDLFEQPVVIKELAEGQFLGGRGWR
jgi:hypothetical protein